MLIHALATFISILGATHAAPAGHDGFDGRFHAASKRQLGTTAGTIGKNATFDYVIVGGGTAGLVMANRLSASPGVSVAVIEAGTFYQVTNLLVGSTPAGDTLFAGSSPLDTNPLVDWNFVTQPQDGANKRRIHYARGKCLGGRLVFISYMIYPDSHTSNKPASL